MVRNLLAPIALAALLFSAAVTFAAPVPGKRHVVRQWDGYSFLPGYRSPERIDWERAQRPERVYWYGGPIFYSGRCTGSGFAPFSTKTPIANVWNCGQ